MYRFVAYIGRFLMSIFGRITIYGKDNLPDKDSGYVIACTHTGWVDVLWLAISLLPRQINFMGKMELFNFKPLGWLLRKLNAFPVNRENPGPSAIKIPTRLIRDDEVVGIFPSGTRTSDDVPLKRGAVTIANRAKAPVVPAVYIGPNNFKELFQFKKPYIIFGEPITAPEDLDRREGIDAMATELDDAFRELRKDLMQKKKQS